MKEHNLKGNKLQADRFDEQCIVLLYVEKKMGKLTKKYEAM